MTETTVEPDPYHDALEAIATAAQALLESGMHHCRNTLPFVKGDRGLNCFSAQALYAEALRDSLLAASRIVDAQAWDKEH